jgi:BASS family bile acid:Na+ symporter
MTDIDAIRLNFSPESLMLLNAILAIVMFSIALDLKPSDFRALVRTPKALLTGMVSQFLVLPAVTFAMLLVTNPQPSIALGLILVASCPGGNISNFITHRAGGNTALSVSMTGIATVAAIFMTPLNIAFWGNLYEPTRAILRETTLDPVSIAITVFFMLILPLDTWHPDQRQAFGFRGTDPQDHAENFHGNLCRFHRRGAGCELGFPAVLALPVAGLVVLHNALALSSGYLSATVMRIVGL